MGCRYLYNFGIKILGRSLDRTVTRRGDTITRRGNVGLDIVVFRGQNPPDGALTLFKELYSLECYEARWLAGQCIPWGVRMQMLTVIRSRA